MTKQIKASDEILKLIEEVDPSDTDKLDEIDARVECFVNPNNTNPIKPSTSSFWYIHNYNNDRVLPPLQYTRSRDALKSIRPDGWAFASIRSYMQDQWVAEFYERGCGSLKQSPELKNEELAELHAIIQAIQWERDNDK